jgi:uncharacterized membrane protein YeaQ/YmgE (transglycosylase-associated protein family)
LFAFLLPQNACSFAKCYVRIVCKQKIHKEKTIMMHIIGQLIVGLIIGAVARLLVPGTAGMGLIVTALLGVGGSFVGTMIGKFIWKENYAAGWLMSILGAVLLVFLYTRFF